MTELMRQCGATQSYNTVWWLLLGAILLALGAMMLAIHFESKAQREGLTKPTLESAGIFLTYLGAAATLIATAYSTLPDCRRGVTDAISTLIAVSIVALVVGGLIFTWRQRRRGTSASPKDDAPETPIAVEEAAGRHCGDHDELMRQAGAQGAESARRETVPVALSAGALGGVLALLGAVLVMGRGGRSR